jgi:hypothetical protein
MDKECQGSDDLYCSCAGKCLATDAAILPQGTATSDCEVAKDALSKFNFDDLKKIAPDSLSPATQKNIATDQCCRNCNKDDRVSKIGVVIDCVAKTIARPPATDLCNVLGADALALSGCPSRTPTQASAQAVTPVLGVLFGLGMLIM